MNIRKTMFLLSFAVSVSFSTPLYMYVGTYSIENDNRFGSLTSMNEIASSFWNELRIEHTNLH